MSKGKRILAAALAFGMGLQVSAGAKVKMQKYPDLSGHWARSIVLKLDEYGVVSGNEAGNFMPEDTTSVACFIKMVVCALGYEEPVGEVYWASNYINRALELELIEPDEFYDYNAPITRAQMAKIISAAVTSPSAIDEYALKAAIYDYADVQEDYKEYVLRAAGEKIITCYEDGSFRAGRYLTRAEACTVVIRLIDRNGGIALPGGDNQMAGGAAVNASASLYVSPDGNDSGNGSIGSPFATIAAAKAAIRKMNESNALPNGGVTVYLRAGTHYVYDGMVFDELDSGREGSTVTYTAYPGEAVTVSGQMPLEASWFTDADAAAKKKLIDQKAAEKLLMVDLKAHNITEYGEIGTRGYHYFNKGRYAVAELIVNGENQTIARYPNTGTISIPADSVDPDNYAFTYSDARISKWKDAADAVIVGATSINYENNTFPIEKIDAGQKKLYIEEGRMRTYYTNGWFYGENLIEEIDAEGEYYIDREKGVLYYYAPADFKSGSYNVGLSTLAKPVFNLNGAHNITISNLTFDGGRGYAIIGTTAGYEMPSFYQWMTDRGIDASHKLLDKSSKNQVYIKDMDKYTEPQTFPGHVWDGFVDEGPGVKDITITNCNIFNFGSGGIIIKGNNVHIENNHIKNIGGTGMFLKGGDLETLEPSGNTIINNEIHRVGYLQKSYVPAIAMHGVAIHVANNDIYDAPHCIFNYHGNDHIIEFNKIHDGVKECLDMDAIYTRNEYMPQWRGNIIRNNYIYNMGIYPVGEYTKQLNVSGIRTDNYGHGLQIYNNVFANIGTDGANNVIGVTAQGNRNTLKGNIFVDCSATFLGWTTYTAGATWDVKNKPEEKERVELAAKYAAIPVFAERYPELATFKDEYYKSVATNIFDENLVVNIKFGLSKTNGEVNKSSTRGAPELIKGDKNIVVTKDPGFVDYANGNYQLKPDSEIFKTLPEFQNVDMSKMGNNAPVGPVN